MSRFYRKVALPPFIVLTVLMLLIQAQSYTGSAELRELFRPDDCHMPCLMGIRPGVTTTDEAMNLLENNTWVADINWHYLPNGIEWKWSGLQPDVINSSESAFLDLSGEKVVERIRVGLSVPVIDLWWSSQKAPLTEMSYAQQGLAQVYAFWYPESGMTVQNALTTCEATMMALLTNHNLLYIHSVETVAEKINTAASILNLPLQWFSFKKSC